MNTSAVLQQIEKLSNETESVFSELSVCFPQLLSVKSMLKPASSIETAPTEVAAGNSLFAVQNSLQTVDVTCRNSTAEETSFFDAYSKKYSELFKTLNEQLASLSELTARIDKVKSDSEEMGIIALNAMVISIKSGEKGRAFSCITENLKRLSGDMNLYSGRLIQEEHLLMDQMEQMQNTYKEIMEMQQSVLGHGFSGTDVIAKISADASASLAEIAAEAGKVLPPILAAMECIQTQDIIRQSLDQVLLCLKESIAADTTHDIATELDALAFNHSVLELSKGVISDVTRQIKKSSDVFNQNWTNVRAVLDSVELKRTHFLAQFLAKNGDGNDNFFSRLDEVFAGFDGLIDDLNRYQALQKIMVASCAGISDDVQLLQSIFDSLRPVVNKLGHVRISQQIEVAKNPAISAVRDTVNNMDSLISNSAAELDITRKLLESFIKNIDKIIASFAVESQRDNLRLSELKMKKMQFFSFLKEFRVTLANLLTNFTVYPPEFRESCRHADAAMNKLQQIYHNFEIVESGLVGTAGNIESMLHDKMKQVGAADWNIKDDHLRRLIDQFTITAHKEQAGVIGGFDVEHGVAAGEITLF